MSVPARARTCRRAALLLAVARVGCAPPPPPAGLAPLVTLDPVRDGFEHLVSAGGQSGPPTEQLFRAGDQTEDLASGEPQRLRAVREEPDALHARVEAEGRARAARRTPRAVELLRKLGCVR